MVSNLKKFKILIADSDQRLAGVSRSMLQGMGFSDIHLTPSGKEALSLITEGNFDFLITDWRLKDIDGISLINHIRRDLDSKNPTMPVIMLTGRMEQSDVQTARDNGIHEYVVKPFTAQTIYNRLERIVEFPRHFVVDKTFVGPDRRNRQQPLPDKERRKRALPAGRKPSNAANAINADTSQLWLPDFTLKQKLGLDINLNSVITADVLSQAQNAIDAVTDASLDWLKEDLVALKSLYIMLSKAQYPSNIADDLSEVTLTISARSGTFGYTRASTVAYMLYLFCRNKLQPANQDHVTIIKKHIEVLQIIFGTNIRGDTGSIIQIIDELKNLTAKYAA